MLDGRSKEQTLANATVSKSIVLLLLVGINGAELSLDHNVVWWLLLFESVEGKVLDKATKVSHSIFVTLSHSILVTLSHSILSL